MTVAQRDITPCFVGVLLLCSGSACSAGENRGKRAHTCECCAEGGPWLCIVFSRWESRGDEGGCSHVCWGHCWSVFFLRLSASGVPLRTSSASDVSQDDGTCPSVYSFAHLWLSLFLSTRFSAPSLFFCWIHCNRLHSFHPYLLCTQLYLVQGEWPDNWLILLIVQVSVPSSLWSTNEGRNGQG